MVVMGLESGWLRDCEDMLIGKNIGPRIEPWGTPPSDKFLNLPQKISYQTDGSQMKWMCPFDLVTPVWTEDAIWNISQRVAIQNADKQEPIRA